jgi:hypothetical protein
MEATTHQTTPNLCTKHDGFVKSHHSGENRSALLRVLSDESTRHLTRKTVLDIKISVGMF